MPRRTVQEVTVQDVQKRRNPNKHYVSLLCNYHNRVICCVKCATDRGYSAVSPFVLLGKVKNKESVKLQLTKSAETVKQTLLEYDFWKLQVLLRLFKSVGIFILKTSNDRHQDLRCYISATCTVTRSQKLLCCYRFSDCFWPNKMLI